MDLAGSERLSKSKSADTRLEEAKAINKSISALGNCINALVDPKQRKHIPFRDSKLTRVLTNSLSGNSKTTLIACISPSLLQYDESLLTLLFAYRATNVVTHATVNDEVMVQQPKKPADDPELLRRNSFLETANLALQEQLGELKKKMENGAAPAGGRTMGRNVSNVERARTALESDENVRPEPGSPVGDEPWASPKYSTVLTRRTDTMSAAAGTMGLMSTNCASNNANKGSGEMRQANRVIKRMLNVVRCLQAEIAKKVRKGE